MRWKENAIVVKGVRVNGGQEVSEADKGNHRLKLIIKSKDPDYIMTSAEEREYLKNQKEEVKEEPKKITKGGEK